MISFPGIIATLLLYQITSEFVSIKFRVTNDATYISSHFGTSPHWFKPLRNLVRLLLLLLKYMIFSHVDDYIVYD